jgi:undecaprenyl-diphosphatase
LIRTFFLAPLLLAAQLPLAAAPSGEAAGLTPSAQGSAERPFVSSTLWAMADFGLTPLRWRAEDLTYLVPSAVALGVLLNNDVPLYDRMALGDARKPWLDHSMPAVSSLGDGFIEFAGAALAAKCGDARLARTSAVAMQGLVVVAAYSAVLKTAAWSNRPSEDDSAHRFWDFGQSSTGFPSGHSFSAFCAAEVYGAEYGRWWTYPFACLIAYSRIYNQAHWPSDVYAGTLLGIAAGCQARQAAESGGVPAIHLSQAPGSATPMLVADAHF